MATPETRPRAFVRLHSGDNVAVSLADLEEGDAIEVEGSVLVIRGEVPFGHKFAIRDLAPGTEVVKYEEVIGVTTAPVGAGEHLHVHNVRSLRARTRP